MSMNRLKTFILLATLTALLLFVGELLGGYGGLVIAGFIVIIMNLVSYFWSHKIVLMMYRAKEIQEKDQPELFRIVHEVAHLANIPMPKVYFVPSEQPNAFATGRNPNNAVVACTAGILRLLSKDELKGVIAHEVSHIRNRDILIQTVAATIAGVISYVAMMARWGAIFGGFGGRDGDNNILEFLVLAIVTPIVATLIQLAISRSREYLADESAAKLLHNQHGLVSALEKLDASGKKIPMRMGSPSTSNMWISNPFRGGALISLLSTHPPMNKRIARLKSMNV